MIDGTPVRVHQHAANSKNATRVVVWAARAVGLNGLIETSPNLARLSIMERFFGLAEAVKALGVSISTLRRWEANGRMAPEPTMGGHRRYDLAKLRPEIFHAADAPRRTVAYAGVSSHGQKADLDRQKQVLELFCANNGR